MQYIVPLTDNIHWVGANDRRLALFENLMPLPKGVSYNAYLIDDKKTALIDTVEACKARNLLDKIEAVIGDRPLDYLVVNHTEPDHSGALQLVINRYPNVQVVGSRTTFKLLHQFYDTGKLKAYTVRNGDNLSLGQHQLHFYATPWVHWPETMMTFESRSGTLFSGDAFGSFGTLDGGLFDDELDIDTFEEEMRRYFSNIVGKYAKHANKAILKLKDLPIKTIASTHGPVWRSDIPKLLKYYNDWTSYTTQKGVVVVFGSMYGHTEAMAELIARRLVEKDIRDIRLYDASKTHISYIISDIWKYRALIAGAPTYDAGLFPPIESLTHELLRMKVENRLIGIFGTRSWNSGGVKNLKKFAEEIGWEEVAPAVEAKGAATEQNFEQALQIADSMAERLHELYP